jgi:insulysin
VVDKQLEAAGLAVDTVRLGTVFEELDMSNLHSSQVIDLVKTFMATEMSLSPEQITAAVDRLEQNLGLQLKQVGLDPTSPTPNGDAASVVAVIITDVPSFKARLPVSTGPVAVSDLSEYEDFDAKL